MNTIEAKKIIYKFFKDEINTAYPSVFKEGSIFWARTKQEMPAKPYIMLTDSVNTKICKRVENFVQSGKKYTRKEVRLTVTFGVYTLNNEENLSDADNFATELIEYVQNLFTVTQKTFDTLYEKEITVNELLASDIRDLSSFSQTNQEFRKEIDIVFEFDDVTESPEAEPALGLDIDIKVDNTDKKIEMEVNNVSL